MLVKALSFLLGVVLVQQFTELPDISNFQLLILVLVSTVCWWYFRSGRFSWFIEMFVMVVLAACWSLFNAGDYMQHKLPEKLAGDDFYIEGVIKDIPVVDAHVQRFMFDIEKISLPEEAVVMPERLRLSWYYGDSVHAGEHWRLLVRLKPPHGFMNLGGFDYEAWLYQKGVHATGYVRKSDANTKLADASSFSLDSLRESISSHIQLVLKNDERAGLITALAVGDRSTINDKDWDTLIRTGTNHLMAISGLHIGLAAAFGFWLVRRIVPTAMMKNIPAQQLAMLAGMAVAVSYALLAGLSIPTQRALLMLSCVVVMVLTRRTNRPVNILATALLLILLWDPVSVLSAGFWFSFMAVAVILYVFSGRAGRNTGWRALIQQWGWMQFSIALALFPFAILLFQQTSLISPLANLILVPYVSFLIVPLVLLALLFMPLSSVISDYLLLAANELLSLIWPLIEALSMHPWAYWVKAAPHWWVLLPALAGVALLLAPKGIPARWLGAVMLLPIVLNSDVKPKVGDFEVAMLDVGQGLSIVVRTANHALVFDAGNRFGSRLDAGDAVVIPFLRHWSIDRLDKLVVSHGDADHIGGAQAVVDIFPDVDVIGQDIAPIYAKNKKSCLRGNSWHWDGVVFEFLHPDDRDYVHRNNHACVLKISTGDSRLLITSDIEEKVEKGLVSAYGDRLRAQVLLVPHHGSKTSSSPAFIAAVNPDIALFPVGYRNRYGHPNTEVVERYRNSGASIHYSGHVGTVKLLFSASDGVELIDEYRKTSQKYWNHIIPD